MKKLITFLSVMSVLLFVNASLAEAKIVRAEVRYWQGNIDSEIQTTENNIIGDKIDFVDTLGFDDTEDFVEARLELGLAMFNFRYGFVSMGWEGTEDITTTLTFVGVTFDTKVDSTLDVDYHRLGLNVDLLDSLDNRVAAIIEIKYFDVDATLDATAYGSTKKETKDGTLPILTVGALVQVDLPFVMNFGGEVTGMVMGDYGHIIDAEAMINFEPVPFFKISAGYRFLQLKLDDRDDNTLDFTVEGPFAGLKFNF